MKLIDLNDFESGSGKYTWSINVDSDILKTWIEKNKLFKGGEAVKLCRIYFKKL